MNCPNCLAANARLVYHQENVIVYQNVLLKEFEEVFNTPRAELQLYYCEVCSFLFNAAFKSNLLSYENNYENAQNHSHFFNDYLAERTNKILLHCQKDFNKILEIGCGNGYFIKQLINSDHRNLGYGFDRSLANNFSDDRLRLINEYYDEHHEGNFDFIVSRHVVEHIPDNYDIFELIKDKNPNAHYFIETPSLEWIINNNAFFDIFYEHCSYFSAYALEKLFARLSVIPKRTEFIFGGQYLWMETVGENSLPACKSLSLSAVQTFFENFKSQILRYQNLIADELYGKKIIVWGAGAKGVTFTNLIDPFKRYISYIVDINPKKQNCFLPGSGHEILSAEKVLDEGADVVFIMNPNYQEEIKRFTQTKIKNFYVI